MKRGVVVRSLRFRFIPLGPSVRFKLLLAVALRPLPALPRLLTHNSKSPPPPSPRPRMLPAVVPLRSPSPIAPIPAAAAAPPKPNKKKRTLLSIKASSPPSSDDDDEIPPPKRARKVDITGVSAVEFKSNKFNGYAFLSNFWPDVKPGAAEAVYAQFPALRGASSSFTLNGHTYTSAEQAYQALRWEFLKMPVVADQFRVKGMTALAAKKLNTVLKKRHSTPPVPLHVMVNIMRKVVDAKFGQCAALKDALLSTGDRTLHEVRGRTKSVWCNDPRNDGIGSDDMLGRLIGTTRTNLRRNAPVAAHFPVAAAAAGPV